MNKVLLFSFPLLLCFGCEKPKEPGPIYYGALNEGLKRDFFYKEGTYWIYKDSLSN